MFLPLFVNLQWCPKLYPLSEHTLIADLVLRQVEASLCKYELFYLLNENKKTSKEGTDKELIHSHTVSIMV